ITPEVTVTQVICYDQYNIWERRQGFGWLVRRGLPGLVSTLGGCSPAPDHRRGNLENRLHSSNHILIISGIPSPRPTKIPAPFSSLTPGHSFNSANRFRRKFTIAFARPKGNLGSHGSGGNRTVRKRATRST